jgi:hypothetical protein
MLHLHSRTLFAARTESVTIPSRVGKGQASGPVRSSEQPCACLRVAASAKAGRHLYLSNCRNLLSWKGSHSSRDLVTHSSKDPPFRGAEKTARVGSLPMNAYQSLAVDN